MKTYSELLNKCEECGITLNPDKEYTKNELEDYTKNHLWNKDHPNETMLLQIEPQLAHSIDELDNTEVDKIWDSPDYCSQIKLDGNRLLLHIGKDKNRATSRRKSDVTFLFSEKTDNIPFQRDFNLSDFDGTILDGEAKMSVAVIDTGSVITSSELQSTSAVLNCSAELSKKLQEKYGSIVYHIFDVLYWKGNSVISLPYKKRLELLDELFVEINARGGTNYFTKVPTIIENKKQFYLNMISQGQEGVMLKDLNSLYESCKRTFSWLKVKSWSEYDGIITGWQYSKEGKGFENLIGSLEVSAYDENRILRPIAYVAPTSLEERKAITIIDSSGKINLRQDILAKVVTIRGREWSGKSIRLKHAVLVCFREDKNPEDCTFNYSLIPKIVEAGGSW